MKLLWNIKINGLRIILREFQVFFACNWVVGSEPNFAYFTQFRMKWKFMSKKIQVNLICLILHRLWQIILSIQVALNWLTKALRTLKSFSWLGRLQNHMQQVFLNSYQTEIEKYLKCWLDKVQILCNGIFYFIHIAFIRELSLI